MKHILLLAMLSATMLARATGTFSIIEINAAHGTEELSFTDSAKQFFGAGEISTYTELNGKLYFVAQDAPGNYELWSTDGTAGGTLLVKEINAAGSAGIGNIALAGNRLYFMATDNGIDYDLWTSDGTTGGTQKVADLNETVNTALEKQNIAPMGNRLVFCTQTQLMITDGTSTGTTPLHSISTYSQGYGYCELNNKVYFILPNLNGDHELWRTDGTDAGTEMVNNISNSGLHMYEPNNMAAFNGKLYCIASATAQGTDLFVTNGNIGDTLQRITLATGGNSYPSTLTLYNSALYFTASTMTGTNVFKISESNNQPVGLLPDSTYSWLTNLSFANNSIYFFADGDQLLHSIDLSTQAHRNFKIDGLNFPNYFNNLQPLLVGAGGKIYFAAYDSATNQQVFVESNGTASGSHVIMPAGVTNAHPFNFLVGCGTADIFDFKMFGNKVIVPAAFTDAGRELWIFQTDLANGIKTVQQEMEVQMFPNPASANLFIQLPINNYCEIQMNIIDIKGALVKTQTLTDGKNSVDLSNLAAGNYCATFVNLITKAVTTKKLVVAK